MEKKYYYLMRKDDVVTAVTLNSDGKMLSYAKDYEKDIMPLEEMKDPQTSLKKWWQNRAVPVGQGKIRHILELNGYSLPEEYLQENLGLSLSDYYWIKPIDSDLTWLKINLFTNEFSDNLLLVRGNEDAISRTPQFTPNSSLQGQLEKTWTIIGNERFLVKGNHDELSAESLNEVIAAEIHRSQGTHSYAEYDLVHIKDKPYDYGCKTKLFTSEKDEYVSAYALYSSEKQPSDTSPFRHLVNICCRHGMDEDMIRDGLDYQTMTDYIISGYDRHLNNIGFIRDADTLRFKGFCPIYDSGGSLFAGQRLPVTMKDLERIKTTGIGSTEKDKLKYVRNPNVIDLTRLPSVSYIRQMYEKDSNMDKRVIDTVCWAYEKKIDMCREYQLGKQEVTKVPFDTSILTSVKAAVKEGTGIKTNRDRISTQGKIIENQQKDL